jgi:nucleotide-binding universal stress UspA family protein
MSGNRFDGPIVLGFDGSPDARLAATAAVDLAKRTGAPLHLVHALLRPGMAIHGAAFEAEIMRRSHEDEESVIAREVSAITDKGSTVAKVHESSRRPAEAIVAIASHTGASLVVVGSRGLGGFRRVLLGSVSEEVVHTAKRPVFVLRGRSRAWPPTRILVGDDSSGSSQRAAELAVDIAQHLGAGISLVRALSPRLADERTPADIRRRQDATNSARAELANHAAALANAGIKHVRTVVEVGDAAAVLTEAAARTAGPTLVVVGMRGLGLVKRIALGSTSIKLLRGYPGPVLIAP